MSKREHWNLRYDYCIGCGREEMKQHMQAIYSGTLYGNPHRLGFMCEPCYFEFLEHHGIDDPKYVCKHTNYEEEDL